jgi:hypothetical protein
MIAVSSCAYHKLVAYPLQHLQLRWCGKHTVISEIEGKDGCDERSKVQSVLQFVWLKYCRNRVHSERLEPKGANHVKCN